MRLHLTFLIHTILDLMVGETMEWVERFSQIYSMFRFLNPEILHKSTNTFKQNVDRLIEQFQGRLQWNLLISCVIQISTFQSTKG